MNITTLDRKCDRCGKNLTKDEVNKVKDGGVCNECYKEYELCPNCGDYEHNDDMTYHKWDIAQREEQICRGCRNNQ
jgi:hypothetical protein